jgi:predicted P-loop ATPase
MSLLEQLQALPEGWGFVAVDGHKRAYQKAWQQHPLTREQMAAEISAGRAQAIGVIAGPTSGGLLFVDHDGLSATEKLEELGLPLRDLPKSLAMTSGRDGRFQIIYSIPDTYWPALRGRRVFKTGKRDTEGKAENLDLRWHGHYSVVAGSHPDTTGYRWLRDRGPQDQSLTEAPPALIELLLRDPDPEPPEQAAPLLQLAPAPQGPATLPLIDFICRDSRDLIESGGTPGAWNDDQLRLSLDLIGTAEWIRQQGHTPDQTPEQAFETHILNARAKARDFDARKAWARFNGAPKHNPHPSTPEDKLRSRLAFHTRQQTKKTGALPQTPVVPSAPRNPTAAPPGPAAPTLTKPQKLEAGELLAHLRQNIAKEGRLRWNTFTSAIELNGSVLDGAERFYLVLAEQGYKCSKDLALDCLIAIARENPYNPVTEYLDHVAATIPPSYIDSLATTYLRPEDHVPQGRPTLYDHMLRCSLIGAVRRAFEPGSKHDTACVLMGDQGARKSSFWAALGGPFFSDSLSDCTSKDDLMKLHRSWIMEWPELDHIMGRRHAGQVKAFLSQSTDLFRVPYGRATEAHPRRGIIVGSTNRQSGFLQDETGNRRFWVIPTSRSESDPIDTPTLAAERDSIWSAAVHAYRRGDPSWLPPDLAGQVSRENESYQVSNPWEPAVAAYLAQRMPGEIITSEAILTHAIERPVERQTRADQMAIADILRHLGYERRRTLAHGSRVWQWLPTQAQQG